MGKESRVVIFCEARGVKVSSKTCSWDMVVHYIGIFGGRDRDIPKGMLWFVIVTGELHTVTNTAHRLVLWDRCMA